jgi:ketosteroid isomerase-like protein
MNNMFPWKIFLIPVLSVSGFMSAVSTPDDAQKAIAASNAIYFSAFVKNDASIFVDRYAADCEIMPPNMPLLKGSAGALKFFRLAYDTLKLRNGQFITTKIYGSGNDFVTEQGIWKSFDKNNQLYDMGKYLVLWKRTNMGWKMFRDSFSSDGKLNR